MSPNFSPRQSTHSVPQVLTVDICRGVEIAAATIERSQSVTDAIFLLWIFTDPANSELNYSQPSKAVEAWEGTPVSGGLARTCATALAVGALLFFLAITLGVFSPPVAPVGDSASLARRR